jgi:DNA-3-methyladenine glycosylase II
MQLNQGPPKVDWSVAQRHLSRVDPVMKGIIRRVGPCTLAARRDYFVKLCQSIYNQQISTKVAAVLFRRFRERFANRRPTPNAVLEFLALDEEVIKSVGLSRQKRVYLHDLATHFANGHVKTRRFATMADEAIIEALTPIKGIGRWSVEMFLIFCLNRPDVWPIDDFGVRKGVQLAYGLAEMPGKAEMIEIGERWRPYRTIASWYLWRSLDKPTKRTR